MNPHVNCTYVCDIEPSLSIQLIFVPCALQLYIQLTLEFCRYFKYELLPKKAIAKEDLLVFLNNWLDRSSDSCMLSPSQLRTWTTAHLNSGAWYLDCSTLFTPIQEMELKRNREAAAIAAEDIVELADVEDDAAREKAVKKREESDRRKAQKVKDAAEKAALREKERIDKAAEKEKGKKKTIEPAKNTNDAVAASSTVDVGSQLQSAPGRGMKRDSQYKLLSQGPIAVDLRGVKDYTVDEFIVNTSLGQILGGGTGPLPQVYEDLKPFLKKVSVFLFHLFNFDLRCFHVYINQCD